METPKLTPTSFLLGLVVLILVALLTGCDDDAADRAERDRLQETLQQSQETIAEQREAHARADRTSDAQLREQRLDVRAVVIIWIALLTALVIVVLLLVREHRLRRVLERLLKRLLGRHQLENKGDR